MGMPIFIDIDGTLTADAHNPNGKPVLQRVEAVKKMIQGGDCIVLWSARGTEYVKDFANKCRISPHICIGKPQYCIDDKQHIMNKQTVKDPSVLDKK